jgi:hypothetical protein
MSEHPGPTGIGKTPAQAARALFKLVSSVEGEYETPAPTRLTVKLEFSDGLYHATLEKPHELPLKYYQIRMIDARPREEAENVI